MPAAPFHRIIDKLKRYYGDPPKPFPTDPFQQVLWVNVAYLADDTRRPPAVARPRLQRTAGTSPPRPLAKRGGILRGLRRSTRNYVRAARRRYSDNAAGTPVAAAPWPGTLPDDRPDL